MVTIAPHRMYFIFTVLFLSHFVGKIATNRSIRDWIVRHCEWYTSKVNRWIRYIYVFISMSALYLNVFVWLENCCRREKLYDMVNESSIRASQQQQQHEHPPSTTQFFTTETISKQFTTKTQSIHTAKNIRTQQN